MPTVEELLRFPRKGDAVIPSPTPLDRYRGDPADAYAFGYRMAANILAEHVRGQGCEAVLFYPVVFLYRHHVELMLKNLIFAFNDPAVRRVTESEELSKEDRDSLQTGKKAHSLHALWGRLLPMVKALGGVVSDEEIKGISSYIQQLTEIDPHSVSFRYATGFEETKAALGRAQKEGALVDLQTFAEAMERLAGILGGLDSYVGEIIGYCDGSGDEL
jgi:hypothetical protein